MGYSRECQKLAQIVLLFAAIFQGCAVGTDKSVVKDCVLPTDQLPSVNARWKTMPVPVAFKAGEWDSSEISDIMAAADTWNQFYSASIGIPQAISIQTNGSPNLSNAAKPSTVCSQGIVSGSSYTGAVVIYKQTQWPYSNQSAIALTTYCQMAGKPLPTLYMAIMEVNYQNFFVAGKKLPDLQSIFTHEFGHLMSLDHSCLLSGSTKNGLSMANCYESNLPDSYFNAVMYPTVFFDTSGFGLQRRDLQANDEGRANCLYKDLYSNGN